MVLSRVLLYRGMLPPAHVRFYEPLKPRYKCPRSSSAPLLTNAFEIGPAYLIRASRPARYLRSLTRPESGRLRCRLGRFRIFGRAYLREQGKFLVARTNLISLIFLTGTGGLWPYCF